MGLVEAFKQILLPIAAPVAITIRLHQQDSPVAISRNNEVALGCHLHEPGLPDVARKNLQPVTLRKFNPFTEQNFPLVPWW